MVVVFKKCTPHKFDLHYYTEQVVLLTLKDGQSTKGSNELEKREVNHLHVHLLQCSNFIVIHIIIYCNTYNTN